MSKKSMYSLALIVSLLGLLSFSVEIRNVYAPHLIITIEADGSISPTSANITTSDNATYTFTADINASIIVQRSNIVVDGDGWTLNGVDFTIMRGFNLTGVSNVTIKNVNMLEFGYAMWLEGASQCVISNNTCTNNEGGIWLVSSTENTVSDNSIKGSVEAVALDSSSGNTITGNNMIESYYGAYVIDNSAGNTISGNSITANEVGISLEESSNNIISGNTITANIDYGVELYGSSNNNSISGNTITGSDYGLWLEGSFNTIFGNDISYNKGSEGIYIAYGVKNNVISGNNITDNRDGVELYDESNNNTICGNNIANNERHGLFQHDSSDNFIYHNNFVNNTNHVLSSNSVNIWNNDVEGNYWSNYTGVDLNHDGIGDTNHTIAANNTDKYPLMGPFNSFDTSVGKRVNVISNSTVDGFEYDLGTIRFYVSNMTADQAYGFCRVEIPHDVLSPPYNVTINDGLTEVLHFNATLYENGSHTWIYFAYQHSKLEIVIVPEFPSLLILPLFMLATLLTVIIYRKKLKPRL